jgi:hypothetical protein
MDAASGRRDLQPGGRSRLLVWPPSDPSLTDAPADSDDKRGPVVIGGVQSGVVFVRCLRGYAHGEPNNGGARGRALGMGSLLPESIAPYRHHSSITFMSHHLSLAQPPRVPM